MAKRDSNGNPIEVMHRWNRPPLSCVACREKKRRCDRVQPCSNCAQRNTPCAYPGQNSETVREELSRNSAEPIDMSQVTSGSSVSGIQTVPRLVTMPSIDEVRPAC